MTDLYLYVEVGTLGITTRDLEEKRSCLSGVYARDDFFIKL